MLSYFHPIIDNGITYSIDMIRLRLDFNSMERIEEFGSYFSSPSCPYYLSIEMYPLSTKAFSYRYLFKFNCADHSDFVFGLGFNGSDRSSGWIGFCEFNPNKVADTNEFKFFLDMLRRFCPWAELVRYDLAIDVPVSRSQCSLSKDKRKYTCIQNSRYDVTEHLGCRNKSGFCKLYNKKMEAGLDYELTRFEITLDADLTYSQVVELLPVIDVTELQLGMTESGLRDTEIVLVDLLKRLPITEQRYYFNRLGRKMKQKIKSYVFTSIDKFCLSKEIFGQLRLQLQDYTIGVKYSSLDYLNYLK